MADLLSRPAPTHLSPSVPQKNPNLRQVPDIEMHRPNSPPNSPSIPRAFSSLRSHFSSAWGGGHKGKSDRLAKADKKKWPSQYDCSADGKSKVVST